MVWSFLSVASDLLHMAIVRYVKYIDRIRLSCRNIIVWLYPCATMGNCERMEMHLKCKCARCHGQTEAQIWKHRIFGAQWWPRLNISYKSTNDDDDDDYAVDVERWR